MEHDRCVGCKYINYPTDSKECTGCIYNAIDKYTPATVWDKIRNMSDEMLYSFLEYVCKSGKELSEILEEFENV